MKTSKVLFMALLVVAMGLFSCSGDDGEQGQQGVPGKDGTNGTNGVDGTDGTNGVDGEDKPNVSFYFQDGFKGYDGTQDAQISDSWGNLDDVTAGLATLGNLNNDANIVMRFDGISEGITSNLLDQGQTCSDAFYVNQATLYLYVDQVDGDAASLYFHFGFYNAQDPLFDQLNTTWQAANQVDFWAGGDGGLSSNWIGPYMGTDDYAINYPVTSAINNKPGWVAIPLPRSIVNEWICNDASNKGFRIRLAIDGGSFGLVTFLSSENPIEDFRPVLVVETEKVQSQSAKSSISNGKEDWESMSYEEKMAPLYKYLEMKKAN